MPELTIQIVGWNSAKHLRNTALALQKVSADQATVCYIDNNSQDDSVTIIRSLLPNADVIRLAKNEGFAQAHNIGLQRCETPFVLTHDPDLAIEWSGIEKLLARIKADESIGAIQGKLLRAESSENKKIIDSAGIVPTLAFNGRERGANEIDNRQFDQPANLWAVTGACGLYRMSALKQVAYSNKEFFDNSFFAYKEDVDLGWRLNKAGWKVLYEPVIVGTHSRTLGRRGITAWGNSFLAVWNRLRSPRTRYSLHNWLWMIIKNASAGQFVLHLPFIALRVLIFLILSIIYPPLFSVWGEIIKESPKMLQKRKVLQPTN